ncbi:hypothetical protein CKO31_12705 [Thiohalocapsa halophila]|uniref:Uncharacterized protein n=1 Tax=Thiohalocapsa halophila TaxID=69359 RepID=A0ABS1CIR4_9GAMM|nr:hypothetical protein [Thiohalocapsa halophila]
MIRNGKGERQRLLLFHVVGDDPSVEGLAQAVGGDEAEALDVAGAGEAGGLVPPVHDVVGGFGHLQVGAAQGLDIAVAQGPAHGAGADERRIPHHKIGLRPRGRARVDVALHRHPGALVRHGLAGDGVGLGGAPVPAGDGAALGVGLEGDVVPGEDGVAALDVVGVFEQGLAGRGLGVGAKVPLEVADPEHGLGDARGAGVGLQAQHLLGAHGGALQLQALLGEAEVGLGLQDLAFQAFQVLKRHIEKIAAAAGRVQHAQGAEAAVEGAHLLDGLRALAVLVQPVGAGLDIGPFGAQGLDDGGQHQALHIGARGVVGAELVALHRVQGALQQGAEDGGLHLLPVGAGGIDEAVDLRPGQGQGLGLREQAAVEVRDRRAQHAGEGAARIHVRPELAQQVRQVVGVVAHVRKQLAEGALGQQADVFCEHGEQAAHQEACHLLRVGAACRLWAGCLRRGVFLCVRSRRGWRSCGLEGLGEPGELGGDGAGDPRAAPGGVQGERVQPDGTQALADLGPAQVLQIDPVRERVRIGDVVGTGAGEVDVDADVAADVGHQQEGRAALLRRQGAGVAAALGVGLEHGRVPGGGLHAQARLLGLQHEAAATVAVDAPDALATVGLVEGDAALEDIGVLRLVRLRRVRRRQAEQSRELGDEELVVGQLGAIRLLPAGDEGVYSVRTRVRAHICGGVLWGHSVWPRRAGKPLAYTSGRHACIPSAPSAPSPGGQRGTLPFSGGVGQIDVKRC